MSPIKVWLGKPYPLGATWRGTGVNFALYSEHATAVDLCLFDSIESSQEEVRIRVTEHSDEVWHAMTQGRGPDRCIDAVGCEAHGTGGVDAVLDNVKAGVKLATDRAHVIRQAIFCCRKGGTVSVPGVYVGLIDKMPFGAAVNKCLTIKTGQTHVHRYGKALLEKIEGGQIDPSFIITHRLPLEEAPAAYKTFRDKEDGCIKVVLKPSGQ